MKINLPLSDWFRRSKASLLASAAVVAISISFGSSQLQAQITWNGAGGDDNWFNGGNWIGGVAPNGTSTDAMVGGPSPVLVNGNVDINSLTVDAAGIVNINQSQNLDFGGTATTTLNNAGTINVGNNADFQFRNTVINSGDINVNAGTSNSDIEIDALGASLDGGGTVTLNGGNAGINGLGGATLTIVDQTIQGQGSVGENTIGIVNQANGLIDANVSGEILNFDVNAVGATNAGTMQASGGGVLRIDGSIVDNTGGQITAHNGSAVRLNNSTITNGDLSSTGTGQISVDISSNVNLADVAISGNFVANNNSDTGISGTINNSGLVEMLAGASSTDIEVQTGNATLTGGGTVKLTGTNAGINGLAGTVLTVGDQTIEGEGSIGENTIGIINSATGVVDANVATSVLNVDASNDGVDNDGVMKATNEGTLRFSGSDVDNAGGLIEAEADSAVTFNSSTISGGTLNTTSTGILNVEGSSNVRFEDLTNSGNLVTQNNSDTELLGTINNTGSIGVIAGTSNTDIEVQTGDATLTGGGTVTLTGANAGINGLSGTVLTIGDQTIEGEGSIGENTMGVINSADGLVDANVSGQVLNLDADSSNDFTNNGTLRSSDGGVLRVSGTQLNNNSVTEALDGSRVELLDSTIIGGTLRSLGSGTVDVLAGTNAFLENVNFEGQLRTFNNSDTGIAGTINNSGSIDVFAGTSNTDIEVQTGDATLTGGGTVTLNGASAGINGLSGTVLTIGDQTIEGEGSIGENSMGVINSANGLVDANVSGQALNIDADSTNNFTNNGTLRSSDGGVLRVSGTQLNNNNLTEALDGSRVELNNSTVTGGTLRSLDSGTVDVLAGTNSFLENVNIEGNLRSFNNSDTGITGTINNSGSIDVIAGTSNTDIEVQAGGATLTGGGTVRLNGVNAGINGIGGATLDIASQIVIGQGNLGENTIDILNGMGGTIEADISGSSLVVDTVGINSATFFTNDGTLRASNGGNLDSLQGVINNGTIDIGAGSEVQARTLTNNVGSLISGDGVLDVEFGSIVVAGDVAPGNSAGTLTLLDDTIFTSTAALQIELESDSLFDFLQVDGNLMLDGMLEVSLLSSFNPLSTDVFAIASASGLGNEIMGEFANAADGSTLLTTDGTGSFVVNYGSNTVTLSNFTLTAVPEPSSAMCLLGLTVGLLVRRKRKV